jgi:DnaJ-class molecular chaperone
MRAAVAAADGSPFYAPPRRRGPPRDFGFIYPEEEDENPAVAERAKNMRVLELKPTATDEELIRAYRRLALENHPDRASPGGQEHARRRMAEINAAYAWLKANKGAA